MLIALRVVHRWTVNLAHGVSGAQRVVKGCVTGTEFKVKETMNVVRLAMEL